MLEARQTALPTPQTKMHQAIEINSCIWCSVLCVVVVRPFKCQSKHKIEVKNHCNAGKSYLTAASAVCRTIICAMNEYWIYNQFSYFFFSFFQLIAANNQRPTGIKRLVRVGGLWALFNSTIAVVASKTLIIMMWRSNNEYVQMQARQSKNNRICFDRKTKEKKKKNRVFSSRL